MRGGRRRATAEAGSYYASNGNGDDDGASVYRLAAASNLLHAEGMRVFSHWILTMPRREIVRGVVVLAVAMMALEGWLDFLAKLGQGELNESARELEGVTFFVATTWSLLRDPGKWGLRVGIFGLAALALGLLVFGALEWGARSHPEDPLSRTLSHDSPWWWIDVGLRLAAWAALAGSALSLRWLYPRRPTRSASNESA